MAILFGIVFFLVSFFMLAIILLQEGKGGGLAAMGGAATDSVMGARNPLRRWTAYLFGGFIVLTVLMNMQFSNTKDVTIDSGLGAEKKTTGEEKAPAIGAPEGEGEKAKDTASPDKEADTKAPVKDAAPTGSVKPVTAPATGKGDIKPVKPSEPVKEISPEKITK